MTTLVVSQQTYNELLGLLRGARPIEFEHHRYGEPFVIYNELHIALKRQRQVRRPAYAAIEDD
jgi:hypothetical protein